VLDDMAMSEPVGAGGVTVLPYLDGERTPNRPNATGTIAGGRSDVRASQIARAAFEGVVCGILDGIDALTDAGVELAGSRLLLLGGGSQSPAYRRVLADLSGRPVVVYDDYERTAIGACVQAAAVIEDASPNDIAAAWGLETGSVTIEPDEVDATAVRERYRILQQTSAPE